MTSLRTPEAEKAYKDYRASLPPNHPCALCELPTLTEFTFWRIVQNMFPYNAIAKTHHMIIPKRHIVETELTENERVELVDIKNTQFSEYNWIIEATQTTKTIPGHLHFHLITGKD